MTFWHPSNWIAAKEVRTRRLLRGWLRYRKRNVQIGNNCVLARGINLEVGTTIEDSVRITGRVRIGRNVYINSFTMISGDITIGDGVLISQFVTIWDRAHRFMNRDLSIWDQHGQHGITDNGYDRKPVVIGDGVWIGPQSTVFRGITIGKGAVIGAGSVVTHDIPAFAVCWGAPARIVKYRQSGGNGDLPS